MGNQLQKGAFGYIEAQKKYTLIRTVVYFALSLSIFFMGYATTGTRKNLLTVVAVLGCLPASKSMVNMIMFFRAKGCSEELHEAILKKAEGLDVFYDLFMTSYQKNFPLSCLVIKGHNIVALSESEKTDAAEAQKHIEESLKLDGYKGYTIKVFKESEKYLYRLEQMKQTEELEPGNKAQVIGTLLSISL